MGETYKFEIPNNTDVVGQVRLLTVHIGKVWGGGREGESERGKGLQHRGCLDVWMERRQHPALTKLQHSCCATLR